MWDAEVTLFYFLFTWVLTQICCTSSSSHSLESSFSNVLPVIYSALHSLSVKAFCLLSVAALRIKRSSFWHQMRNWIHAGIKSSEWSSDNTLKFQTALESVGGQCDLRRSSAERWERSEVKLVSLPRDSFITGCSYHFITNISFNVSDSKWHLSKVASFGKKIQWLWISCRCVCVFTALLKIFHLHGVDKIKRTPYGRFFSAPFSPVLRCHFSAELSMLSLVSVSKTTDSAGVGL